MIRAGLRRKGIFLVLAYLTLLLVSALSIMAVEPKDSGLAQFANALWWSVVTSTTVGYGDLYPATRAGQVVAALLPMFMGIGIGAAFITHVASYLIERKDRKMHGDAPFTGTDHILIVGMTGDTEHLISQIRQDKTYADREIVLLARLNRHPFPESENVFFINGHPDTTRAMERANTHQAWQIIIHTGSDEDSLFALINALKLRKPGCDITVRCLSSQSLETFSSVPGEFEVIMQMTAEMMVQAMQDKVHLPLQILLNNNEDAEIYLVSIPKIAADTTWWDLHLFLMDTRGYLSFALKTPEGNIMVNPAKHMPITAGSSIWLIARDRPVNLKWPV